MGGAKNCPETPRQKMIGMMYLVLTAMLALNVSADILNGFSKLRTSMEESMVGTKLRTDDAMQLFQEAYESDGGAKKYGDWWVIAQAVRDSSDGFYNYIENFKMDIVRMVEGDNKLDTVPQILKGGSDTNKPHEYALTQKDEFGVVRATALKNHMDEYRRYVTEVESPCLLHKIESSSKVKHDWEQRQQMMYALFNTNKAKNAEGELQDWELSVFSEMPAAAVIALLTKYQNDIRTAQNDLVNFLFTAAGQADFAANYVKPVVLPVTKTYVMQGQPFEAEIWSAMMDTTRPPRVFINGQELTARDGEKAVTYRVTAGGVGDKHEHGYILVGEDTTKYEFDIDYTVGGKGASFAHTELNVMYVGYENVFSVSVPGCSANEVTVQCAAATPQNMGNGKWKIKPSAAGETTVNIYAKVGGQNMQMESLKYVIRDLPKPNAMLRLNGKNYPAAKAPAATLPNCTLVAGYDESAVIRPEWTIKSYKLTFRGKTVNSFKQVNDLKARKGDIIQISDINAQGPAGVRKLQNIPLEVQ